MWARGVVVVEPVWQRGGALAVRAVDEAVSPFASHRLVEALHLPVRARPVGLGGQVSDPEPLELLSDESAACVGPGVIRHQPPRCDPVLGVEAERTIEEAGDRRRFGVAVDLDIGEPGVVVDDRVHDVDAVLVLAVLA